MRLVAKNNSISASVIKRLPRYYSYLEELMTENVERISSKGLAERMKTTASQIRQDLNCFGGFGQQGYGYNIKALHDEIGNILGINKEYKAILIGAGNLGTAIASQISFEKKGCKLNAIFDIDTNIIGKSIAGIEVSDINQVEQYCKENSPSIAVLCIPKSNAFEVAKKLIELGVKSFWNFSHFDLNLHFDNIVVENVHLGDSLLTLTYKTKNQ